MARQDNNIRAKLRDSVQIHENLEQHAWLILEDKVKLTLIDYEEQFRVPYDWKTPLSIFVTLILAILTANFKDFEIISSEALNGIAYAAAFFFASLAAKNGWKAIRRKRVKIDDVIQELRESSDQQKESKTSDDYSD